MKRLQFFLVVIPTILFMAGIGVIDVSVLTPLLTLPDDICYYHVNKPPMWIKLFYLDHSGHVTSVNGLHLLILFLISLVLGSLVTKKIMPVILNRMNRKNKNAEGNLRLML